MPLQFKPARDARHRRACFSLYRALLLEGLRVPLPDSFTATVGPVNPIKTLIRNGFRRNRHDTSPRLVVSALKNGYRFLSLLRTAAESPSGPVHDDVVTFLHENHLHMIGPKALRIPREPFKLRLPDPPEDWTPLLTRVKEATPMTPPVYKATYRPLPLEKLSGGVRKVPVLDHTSGIPFLRLGDPQSPRLSRILHWLSKRRKERIQELVELRANGKEFPQEEDHWEKLLADLARKNGVSWVNLATEGSYVETTYKIIKDLSTKLNMEQVDLVARGQALWDIVVQERALAEKEEKERAENEDRERERTERGQVGKGDALEATSGREAAIETPTESVSLEDIFQRLRVVDSNEKSYPSRTARKRKE